MNRFELNEALGRDLMGYRVVPRGEGSFLLVTRKGSPVSAFSKAAHKTEEEAWGEHPPTLTGTPPLF